MRSDDGRGRSRHRVLCWLWPSGPCCAVGWTATFFRYCVPLNSDNPSACLTSILASLKSRRKFSFCIKAVAIAVAPRRPASTSVGK